MLGYNRDLIDLSPAELVVHLNQRLAGSFTGSLGAQVRSTAPNALVMELPVEPRHLASNGFLHAGVVITLADSSCGFGCYAHLPPGAHNFATIEVKTNFLRTARQGIIRSEAQLIHGGRTTQVWDATVLDTSDRTLALFRCTQLILYA